jgi:hypothetical protein
MSRQAIITTIWGPYAASVQQTFSSFLKVPDADLHVFVFNDKLPDYRHPQFNYHLVWRDRAFRSVRRDALFRRWTLLDYVGAEYALVVDGTDAICLQPLPRFSTLLGANYVAGCPEWGPPMRILGQGYSSTYLNAGVTFWHVPTTIKIRNEIVDRGRACYRGPFDDQTVLNEVLQTKYFNLLGVLPAQYNWRALYQKNFRSWHHHFRAWPRVDCLDGVRIYHNQHCIYEVLNAIEARQPSVTAHLPDLASDPPHLAFRQALWRRIAHRLKYS